MEFIKIGKGYEPPMGDYSGVRLVINGETEVEVRMTGTAVAVMESDPDIHGDPFSRMEYIARNIYNNGTYGAKYCIGIDTSTLYMAEHIIKHPYNFRWK
jgi:hypothetical protein